MDWVVFWIFLGLGILNLTGIGVYHYQYAHDKHEVEWYKDKVFWGGTIYLAALGVTYLGALLASWIIKKIRGVE